MANRKRPSRITQKKAVLAEINRVLKEQRSKPSNTKVMLTIPKSGVYIAAQLGKLCIPPMTPNRYINDAVEAFGPATAFTT
jgi:hypothetical protein